MPFVNVEQSHDSDRQNIASDGGGRPTLEHPPSKKHKNQINRHKNSPGSLKEISSNKQREFPGKSNDTKLANFANFFLSPSSLTKKLEPECSQTFIKHEPTDTSKACLIPSITCSPTTNPAVENPVLNTSTGNEEKRVSKSKKRDHNQKMFKRTAEVAATGPIVDEVESLEKSVNDPGVFKKIDHKLYEREIALAHDDNTQLFEGITDENELKFCHENASFGLIDWMDRGEELIEENRTLMKNLVQTRIDLSHKFLILSEVINARAEALEMQGERIDGKLKQIKDIANNILNVI
ncbi:Ecm11p KNAG_0C02710 [Huiozyma naganishii CBS 8797]|uniref:Extracellular mutant protein 11 C-terminal domain-containing protein n=1 Tax=Huiozyma naganishii (strain ATCC MYA-139 / BCRC 22969 / CBS 8797 / KCTC 17520 / NBRC 10181 / NCYC 3082 / Yp74L-3) TaxID=1071383 RepID=J7RWJ3_HUIN7|nr:hypothetical protein KNAG_0C02710 [Kazachstania naganishii CBS 8797]CCK69382.1 hypothetical protein KNAG_0C02710 [Kazachstania naganishii CBS 8797]